MRNDKALTATENNSARVFDRIMVAVDQSDQSRYAMEIARKLAAAVHADLTLIHVVHLPPATHPDLAYLDISARPACLEGGQELLDALAAECGPRTYKVLREGDPATQIVDAATRLGADLLVMGTHGRGRFASVVIGSVAQHVMQKAVCPVMCVAHPSEQHQHADVAAQSQQPDSPAEVRSCVTR